MSHLTNPLRTGIAAGSFSGSARTSPFPIYGGSTNPVDTIGDTIARQNGLFGSTLYSFPPDLPPVHLNIIEAQWNQVGTSSGVLIPEKLYQLPLPKQLQDPFEVSYQQNFAPGSMLGITDQINQGLSFLFGNIINTFKTVTMNQPLYRRLSMDFKLAPKTFQESETIQRIQFHLRKGMTPKRVANTQTAVLRFPKIYVPYFSPNPKFLYKFKPCVLEKVNVNFAGGNPTPAFYRQEGSDTQNVPPESINLQMVFLELEYWLDGTNQGLTDYKEGDNGLPSDDPFASTRYFSFGTPPPITGPTVSGPTGSVIDTPGSNETITPTPFGGGIGV